MSDLVLPKELAESNLTLEEIGSIVVFYSLPKMDSQFQSFWATNHKMIEIGEQLVDKGILKFSKNDDDEQIVEIDLTSSERKNDFWEIYDYDDNDNPIYFHDSYYGDEESTFKYLLSPVLHGGEVWWKIDSEFGVVTKQLIKFEEAEKIVREELRKELEQIKLEELKKQNGG